LFRVFHQSDGDRQFSLDRLAGRLVPSHKPAGRAGVDLADEKVPHRGIIGPLDLRPDLAVGIAKAGEGAEALGVGELQGRPVDQIGLIQIGVSAGGFGPVEVDLGVSAVAKRLGARLAAATEGIAGADGDGVSLVPPLRAALRVHANGLPGERNGAGDQIGTVRRDGNAGGGRRL
jgi:hypothetical protein